MGDWRLHVFSPRIIHAHCEYQAKDDTRIRTLCVYCSQFALKADKKQVHAPVFQGILRHTGLSVLFMCPVLLMKSICKHEYLP